MCAAACWAGFAGMAPAQENKPEEGEGAGAEAKATDENAPVVRTHEVEIGGVAISYTSTTGTIPLKDDEGNATASVFYVAYTREGVDTEKEPGKRPLMFAFNGGPGSSSVWLHMGALGPRRAPFPGDGTQLPKPPFALADNAYSVLDVADLVFIDPVSTGFSRASKPDEAGKFHGLEEDIESVGSFVRLYVTRNRRWASPKFLIGESYGAVRAAGLVRHLQDRHGMYCNGVVLLSGLLDFSTLRAAPNNDLPYVLFLPTMTATAFYHRRLDDELMADFSATLRKSEEFARGAYANALFQGNALEGEERSRIAGLAARYTGLEAGLVERSNLRISTSRFRRELLGLESGRSVGRFDARVTGWESDRAAVQPEYDPSYSVVLGPYASTVNDYLRRGLGFESDLPYEILTGLRWNYPDDAGYVSVSGRLRDAMRDNPHLKVLVACGYYDLATPHFAILHSLNHLDLDAELRSNIRVEYYQGGHMMYTNPEELEKLKKDLTGFIGSAL